ncbi:hypothetical protein OHB12_34355 [Nocardia sp. NBC_01730]|uniref:hypothetical protein n=1 Tax=Nocardia sp. NBC_01730 TaxID=2975998 RepID=UPI002E0F54C4|nr:hypothetical protein OHB12_34355 [Nocardia sp. NBC_01730]
MTTLAVDPNVYYSAARRCHEAAVELYGAYANAVGSLKQHCDGMAGTFDAAQAWARTYDEGALAVLAGWESAVRAAENYAEVLRQAGHNHAIAEHDAAGAPGAPPPAPALPTTSPGCTPSSPPSAGGPSHGGLIDGGIGLASKVGIPVPDGDVDKLENARKIWSYLASGEPIGAASDKLRGLAGMFDGIISDEIPFVIEDLNELSGSVEELKAASNDQATSCTDYKRHTEELREQLEGIIIQFATELGVDAIFAAVASAVSFGLGGAVGAAKLAKTIDKFHKIIERAIDAWKVAKNIARGIPPTIWQGAKKAWEKLKRLCELGKNIYQKWRKRTPGDGAPTKLPTPQEAQEIIRNADRTGSGLKPDVFHRSASFPVDDIGKKGTVTELVGGDGRAVTLVQMPGEVNGAPGRFEWIIDDGGKVVHQLFVRNGTINGIPTKP